MTDIQFYDDDEFLDSGDLPEDEWYSVDTITFDVDVLITGLRLPGPIADAFRDFARDVDGRLALIPVEPEGLPKAAVHEALQEAFDEIEDETDRNAVAQIVLYIISQITARRRGRAPRGGVWLHNLPTVLRNAGLKVVEFPGWQTRSRSTGGYDQLLAIQVHHTASSTTPANDTAYMWNNARDKPIGAVYLARDGTVHIGAAGATNTSGKGGPLSTSRGTIPLDGANRYVLSIEAANNGVGEAWPKAQQDAYVKMVGALAKAYGIQVRRGDIHAHHEWTTRKVDPAGSSRFATGSAKWNMDTFRAEVERSTMPPPDPGPPPPVALPGGNVFVPVSPYRNSDTRKFPGVPIAANRDYVFGLNPSIIPTDAKAVAMNIAVVATGKQGWIAFWPDGTAFRNTSTINFDADGAHSGSTVIGVKALNFRLRANAPVHVICDVTGYWK